MLSFISLIHIYICIHIYIYITPCTVITANFKAIENKKSKRCIVVHVCNPSYVGSKGETSRLVWSKLARPYLKNKIQTKRWGCIVQVTEHLPSMHEALDSVTTPVHKRHRERFHFTLIYYLSSIHLWIMSELSHFPFLGRTFHIYFRVVC
jgi:hypothetical protein